MARITVRREVVGRADYQKSLIHHALELGRESMMPDEADLARHLRAHGDVHHISLRFNFGRLVVERSRLAVLMRLHVENPVILVPSQIVLHLVLERLTQQERKVVLLVDVLMISDHGGLDRFDLIEIDERASHRFTWVVKRPERAVLDNPIVSCRFSRTVHLLERALAIEGCARDEYLGRQIDREKIDQRGLTAAQWRNVVTEAIDRSE